MISSIDFQKVPLSVIFSPLYTKMKTAYDPNDIEHVKLLKSLWKNLNPDIELDGMISDKWSDIGFQGKDPSTDFRGMGLLGLENLVYFSSKFPEKTRNYLTREYPFAVTGINLTSFIITLLKSKVDYEDTPLKILMIKEQFSEGFLKRCVKEGRCYLFEEMYCILFQLFDSIWTHRKATYFEFGAILKETEQRISQVLMKNPTNYSTFSFLLDFNEDHIDIELD